MNFNGYLTEIHKIDEALLRAMSLVETSKRLQIQVNNLKKKKAETDESQTKKTQLSETQIKKKKKSDAELIEELSAKIVSMEQESKLWHAKAVEWEDNLLNQTKKELGEEATIHVRETIDNLKINRKLLPEKKHPQNEDLLPDNLLKANSDVSNHGFNLITYQKILHLAKLAYAIEKDGVPELHAYKLTILFGHTDLQISDPLKYVGDYLRTVAKIDPDNPKFFHDACLFNLPRGSQWTVEAWRLLVRQDLFNFAIGERGVVIALSEAERIEEKLLTPVERVEKNKWLEKTKREAEKLQNQKQKKPQLKANMTEKSTHKKDIESAWIDEWKRIRPKVLSQASLKKINEIYSSLTYTRGHENLEAAVKFRKYAMSEADFNKYLELKPKNSDLIPSLVIDGADVSSQFIGYYIKKMDPFDPMCAVLGKKTGCCQSIGGAGEDCAIHGITSAYGGFYVICAGDAKNPKPSDDIRAQCWAWRSKTDALVFDSLEIQKNIKTSKIGNFQGEEMASCMFASLANQLVENYNIPSVNIGVGGLGGTPAILGIFSVNPEFPIDYDGYRDSNNQRNVCNLKNITSSKLFYQVLSVMIEHARDPDHHSQERVSNLLNQLCPDETIYLLAQIILLDQNEELLNEKQLKELFSAYNKPNPSLITKNTEKMQACIIKLLQDKTQFERAKRLFTLHKLGLDINKTFCISGTNDEPIVMGGSMTILDIFLKERSWQDAKELLNLGIDVTKGKPMIWAIGDATKFMREEFQKIEKEQMDLIRELVKRGADINVTDSWWNDITISPIDLLIISGNSDKIVEFLTWNVDRNIGQPVATAANEVNLQLMQELINNGFSTQNGDVLSSFISSGKFDMIDEILAQGAKRETSGALVTSLFFLESPHVAFELLKRGVGTDKKTFKQHETVKIALEYKRYDFLPFILDLITNLDNVIYFQQYTDDITEVIPKTLLICLIEDKQFKLAKEVVARGANLASQNAENPIGEEMPSVLKDTHTNFVVQASIAQHTEEAYQFALELIAKGAPLTRVNLNEVVDNQKIGLLLLKMAIAQNNDKAIEVLHNEGFKLELPTFSSRAKSVRFTPSRTDSDEALPKKLETSQDVTPKNK